VAYQDGRLKKWACDAWFVVFCAMFAVEMLNDLRKHYTDQKPHIDAFLASLRNHR
jgi:hypothetical protein